MRSAFRRLISAAWCLAALGCGESPTGASPEGMQAGAAGGAATSKPLGSGGGQSSAGSTSGNAAGTQSASGSSSGGNGGTNGVEVGGVGGTGGVAGAAGVAGAGGSVAGTSGAAGSSGGGAGGPSIDHGARGVIVVLGASTAAGTGPSNPQNAWVERYRSYLAKEFVNFELINLAVSGYTTYHEQPDGFTPPQGRPAPDTAHNITMALAKHPGAILINLPSNDTDTNVPFQDQMDNFGRMTDLANQAGVLVWVSTTQPRNFSQQAQRMLQMQVRDAIKTKYGAHTLDFWTAFAQADGTIKAMYDSGDGIHLNDEAHALLVQAVIDAKVPEAILSKP